MEESIPELKSIRLLKSEFRTLSRAKITLFVSQTIFRSPDVIFHAIQKEMES
jgi:hypothetical protein